MLLVLGAQLNDGEKIVLYNSNQNLPRMENPFQLCGDEIVCVGKLDIGDVDTETIRETPTVWIIYMPTKMYPIPEGKRRKLHFFCFGNSFQLSFPEALELFESSG